MTDIERIAALEATVARLERELQQALGRIIALEARPVERLVVGPAFPERTPNHPPHWPDIVCGWPSMTTTQAGN